VREEVTAGRDSGGNRVQDCGERVPSDLSTFGYINSPIKSPQRRIALKDLPPECYACGSWCGSVLTRSGPCVLKKDRGCLLRKIPGFALIDPSGNCVDAGVSL